MKLNQGIIWQVTGCFWLVFLLTSGCRNKSESLQIDLSIRYGILLTADPEQPILHDGLLLIQADEIVYLGPVGQAPPFQANTSIDAREKLISPGWVNTHSHAAMTMFRGMADDLPLQTWLEDYIWPMEGTILSPETVRVGSRLAIAEMLSHGVTTFADMYFFEEEVAKAADELGIRVMIGEGVLMFPTASSPTPQDALSRTIDLYETWHDHPRVYVSVAPHSPYTLSDADLLACDSLAKTLQIPMQIHLSETAEELANSLRTHGVSPVARLNQLGLLRQGTLAAHCVHISPEDIDILHENHTAVAHCPESNLKLGSGIAPIPELLRAGVVVGAGTDGAASNNNLDLQQDLHTGSLIQKGLHQNPALLTAKDWFMMGTIEGARALGLDHEIGSLSPGKQADLLIYGLNAAQATPMYDPYSHLIYSMSHRDLQQVIVAGKTVWKAGSLTTGNEAEIRTEVKTIADQIRANL